MPCWADTVEKDIYVSTSELREHLASSREVLRMTDDLHNRIKRLKYFDVLSGDHRCREAENDVQKTENQLQNVFDALGQLCGNIEDLIVENTSKISAAQQNAEDVIRHYR